MQVARKCCSVLDEDIHRCMLSVHGSLTASITSSCYALYRTKVGMTIYLMTSAGPQLPGHCEEVESTGLLDNPFAYGAQLAPQFMQHLAPGVSGTAFDTWAPMTLMTAMLTWMQQMHVLHSPLP